MNLLRLYHPEANVIILHCVRVPKRSVCSLKVKTLVLFPVQPLEDNYLLNNTRLSRSFNIIHSLLESEFFELNFTAASTFASSFRGTSFNCFHILIDRV